MLYRFITYHRYVCARRRYARGNAVRRHPEEAVHPIPDPCTVSTSLLWPSLACFPCASAVAPPIWPSSVLPRERSEQDWKVRVRTTRRRKPSRSRRPIRRTRRRLATGSDKDCCRYVRFSGHRDFFNAPSEDGPDLKNRTSNQPMVPFFCRETKGSDLAACAREGSGT